MTAAGIVCEYNPFHNGHLAQFSATRAALGPDAALICVMSGNFVQRGDCAALDRSLRARAAVQAGASLVLELPVTACLSSAEGFARGAIDLLAALGCVTHLSFGCECGSQAALDRVTDILLCAGFPAALREGLSRGLGFAAARQRAVEALGGDGGLLARPNNILAVEYCKALRSSGCGILPLALARGGDYHTGADPMAPSAAAIRALLLAQNPAWERLVPAAAAELYRAAPLYSLEAGQRAVLARLRTLPEPNWDALPHGGEGLCRRVRRAAMEQPDLACVIRAAGTKRYPTARIRRLLLCAYLGVTARDLARPVPYARVLAFDDLGRAVLRRARDLGALPLVHAGEPGPDEAWWALEQRASDLFGLCCWDLDAAPPGAAARDRAFYLQKT